MSNPGNTQGGLVSQNCLPFVGEEESLTNRTQQKQNELEEHCMPVICLCKHRR
jgi:hypothetical protein